MRSLIVFSLASAAAGNEVVPPLWGDGGQLRDSNNATVRLQCVSWSGAEQKDFVVGGLDHNRPSSIVNKVKEWGFNCVRLPWSVEMVLTNPEVKSRNLKAVEGSDWLKTRNALDIFDHIVKTVTGNGLMVVLDNHNSNADWCCSDNDGNGLWYTDHYPEEKWLEAWDIMAKRYVSNRMVVAAELRNEIRAATINKTVVTPTWGGFHAMGKDESFLSVPKFAGVDEKSDWAAAAERAARRVHRTAPEWLVAVHGLDYAYVSAPLVQVRPIDKLSLSQGRAKVSLLEDTGSSNKPHTITKFRMGSNHASFSFTEVAAKRQLDVPKKDKLLYVAHDFDWYHPVLTDYPTFEKYVDLAWGNTANKGTAPVWISEFGTPHNGVHISSEGCFGDDAQEAMQSKWKVRGKLDWIVNQEMTALASKGINIARLHEYTGMTKDELTSSLMDGDTKKVQDAYNTLKATRTKKQSFAQRLDTDNEDEGIVPTAIQDALLNIYNHVKPLIKDQRKPARQDCWWPYLMRYLKEHPHISYGYWRLDGTESRGSGRTFGAEEGFGLLDAAWQRSASGPLITQLKRLHQNQM